MADGSSVQCLGRAKTSITIGKESHEMTVFVFKKLHHDIVVGTDAIDKFLLEQRVGLKIFQHNKPLTNRENKTKKKQINNCIDQVKSRYNDVFTGCGKTKRTAHTIDVSSNRLIRHKAQNIPIHWMKDIANHIKELLDLDIIEESKSEYRSRIVPIKKKDGSVRLAIDYRDLNKISNNDAFPMPRIKDILFKLSKARIFSKMDLKRGYYQIPMEENSKRYTAFAFKNKLYQFKMMPFGLVAAPQTFQRLMESILGHLDFVECYLDDVIIFSKNEQEHHKHLDQVFKILRKENLKLNEEKCEFYMKEIDYLGFNIKQGQRSMIATNKKKLLQFPRPSNQNETKTFVCLAGYYRELIKDFAKICKPLYDCSNQKKFKWLHEQEEAFNQLKEAVKKNPSIMIPDMEQKFTVTTDASDNAMGAVLSQTINGVKTPVDFFSRGFNDTQKRYSTYEKEATALIQALKYWQYLLIGKPFILETDHKPLKWLLSKKDCSGKLGRMVLKLADFQIENIEYIKGTDNVLADTLSRLQMNCMADSNQMDDVIRRDPNNFRYQNGRWYFVDGSSNPESLRAYIRNIDERKELLKTIHDIGHFGVFKCTEEIRKRFWWPGWKSQVKQMVSSCPRCEQYKEDTEKTRLPMIPSQAEPNNWRRIGIDIAGPWQTTENGNKYMLIIQDYASKFVVAKAVASTSTDIITEWLRQTFQNFGWPQTILHDCGPQFQSEQFKSFARENHISLEEATIAHHQTNGMVERVIRTIESIIRISANDHSRWDDTLSEAVTAYNGSKHFSTSMSPFKAMYGRDMTTQLDLRYGIVHNDEDTEILREQRLARHDIAQQHQKEQYDKKVKIEPIQIGDRVLWHLVEATRGSSKKFNQRWKGPFIVTEMNHPNMKIEDRNGNFRWIHHNHLKKSRSENTVLDIIRNRGRPRMHPS